MENVLTCAEIQPEVSKPKLLLLFQCSDTAIHLCYQFTYSRCHLIFNVGGHFKRETSLLLVPAPNLELPTIA